MDLTRKAAGLFVVLVALGGALLSDFRLADPESTVYYHFAVVAGEAIQVEKDAQVTGNLHGNGTIVLKKDSLVTGDVSAVGAMTLQGTVTGTVTPGAAPLALPQLDLTALRELADRVFTGDTIFNEDVMIDDVIFVEGTVHFRGSVNGTGTIVAIGDVRLDTVGNNPSFVLAETTRLSLIAGVDVRLAKDRPLRGVIRAGHDAQLEMNTVFDGVIVADNQVLVKKASRVTFVDFDQEAPMITLVSPADGSVLDASPTEIVAEWSDDFSGVDVSTASILVDGVERTAEASITDAGLSLPLAEELAEGSHTVVVEVSDFAGNLRVASFAFTVEGMRDEAPPELIIVSPTDGAQLTASPETLELAFSDTGSGIDPASLRLFLDEVDLSTACDPVPGGASCLTFNIPIGAHQLVAEISDLAGNTTTASSDFTVIQPDVPPVIEITEPAPGLLTNAETVMVTGQVFTTGTIVELTVNEVSVPLVGDSFGLEIPTEDGLFAIVARAVDDEGRVGVEQITLRVDRTPPELMIAEPVDGSLSNVDSVRVSGLAMDGFGLVEVTVEGQPVALDLADFETTASLVPGTNAISIVARDEVGNEEARVIDVDYQLPLVVSITEPPDQLQATTDTVTVRGIVDGNPTEVTVADLPATLDGNGFSAEVPLVLGSNPIAVVVHDAGGRVGKAVVTVLRDSSAPRIVFTAPTEGQVVFEPTVDAVGLINDIIGTVAPTDEPFTVSVKGQPAQVEGGSFALAGIALQPGVNVLTATVTDDSGNQGETSVSVLFEQPTSARLLRVSGSGQAAIIGSALAAPFVVQALDASGQPVASVPVVFRVSEGDGRLDSQLDGGERQAVVFSDGSGLAAIGFEVGTRAGKGNHMVEATAVGFAGVARFFSDALPGEAVALVVDTGTQQLGITAQPLPEPLVAIAVDDAFNPIPGLPVTFEVVTGGGHFDNGQGTLEVVTDAKGQAIASLTLGPQEGEANNAVVAKLAPADPPPPDGTPSAAFVASALGLGSGPTTIRGVVLDNTDQPVPGVTLAIAGTSIEATADSQGIFVLENTPAGTIHLQVDGGTATRPGPWPHLEFIFQAIPGRDNEMPRPIYLLPLDTEGVFVSETEGGTLRLDELAGFELEVAPGSATFPDGSRSGVVSVTVVHGDKVPMIPSFYQQPRLVITVQPSGTLFDPPARLTLPNLDGHAIGEVIDFFSFDHDLVRFVSIGPAQVSEDGTTVRSKPGFGIVEGGWHCGDNPSGSGTPNKCPDCRECHPEDKVCSILKPQCNPCGKDDEGKVCDGKGSCVTGLTILPEICDQVRIQDTGLMDIPRADPLVQDRLRCASDDCYIGKRLSYTSVTHNCDGADLEGARFTETVTRSGGDCPEIPVATGIGGEVVDNNRLQSIIDPSRPPRDTYALCGPATKLNEGTCTATFKQTLSIGGCVAEEYTLTYSLERVGDSCGNWDFQRQ